jgi:hypothetical protein
VGWYADDAQFSYLSSALEARHETLWHAIVAANQLWIEANGRLYPLAIAEKYALFDVLRDPVAYKAVLIGLTLACIAAFAGLVRAVADATTALLAACIVAATLPLRAYHDANLAYDGMLQVVFLSLTASLAAWRAAALGRNPWAALLAIALYAANCLTYEIAYLFFPLYACVVRPARAWPRAILGTWPFVAITLGLGGTSIWLRSRVHLDPTSDYSLGLQAGAYATTFAKQLLAGVPLTYEFFDPQRLFPSLQKIALLNAGPYAFRIPAALAFVAILVVLARFGGIARTANERPARQLGSALLGAALLGAGLAVLPVPLIAASAKYQRELAWGWGYLPAFVQAFGVALLLAVLVRALLVRAVRMPLAVAALALFVAADLTAGSNAIVGEALGTETASRGVVERAFARGLGRDVPPGATIVLPNLPWVCEEPLCPDGLRPGFLLYGLTGKRYTTVAPDDPAYANVTAFRLTYSAAARDAATVALARGGAAPSDVRYREFRNGAWSLSRGERGRKS